MFSSFAKNIPQRDQVQRVWTEIKRDCKFDIIKIINFLCMISYRTFKAKDSRVSQTVSLSHHVLDTDRQVMYCWLHKVASSFWMWLFLWIKVSDAL